MIYWNQMDGNNVGVDIDIGGIVKVQARATDSVSTARKIGEGLKKREAESSPGYNEKWGFADGAYLLRLPFS